MEVPFSTVGPLHEELRDEMLAAFARVYDNNWFIGGSECEAFENEYAEWCGTKYCVGCSNGLDALHLMLRAAGISPGDEVIIPSNTFIATALSISYIGARPVLVEPNLATYVLDGSTIEAAISPKTKAVIAVHLYGQMADMVPIREICDRYKLLLFEDAAQSHGAVYHGYGAGFYSDGAAFSFYPGKNLGALGDAGAVVTNDAALANQVRTLSNYGSSERYYHITQGFNCRLDTLQAALMHVKLKKINKVTENRQAIAEQYLAQIKNDKVILPVIGKERTHVWHIFAVRTEDKARLKMHLTQSGIHTSEHYPVAICDQEAYLGAGIGVQAIARKISREELSLPIYYGMAQEEVKYVIDTINKY